MVYPFMTLDDNTEIVHSEMNSDGKVKVYIEQPDEQLCFDLLASGLHMWVLYCTVRRNHTLYSAFDS